GKSSSSTRLGGSIGKRSAVIGARGAVGEHEPLAVRQRLGDGEAPLAVAEVVSEEGEREVVAGPRGAAELRLQAVEPVAVVLDQLARARGRIGDRVAVAGKREPRPERDRPLERTQVVAERIGTSVRIEPDR